MTNHAETSRPVEPDNAHQTTHQPLTLESGPGDCIERECEEYYGEDGEPYPGVTSCSHLTDVVVCSGCTPEPTDDGLYLTSVPWPCPLADAGSAV
jgi:hypothetical protein